ncbi:hypothetical protein MNBD_GAMMA24-2691 [hydrothermal vent metagenome]|uniref:Uncharacterized protein n=1 Tax=hydrothermal vent metagenome TaxID=652676 RepID=A0A3B1CBJ6_9ZZZZ
MSKKTKPTGIRIFILACLMMSSATLSAREFRIQCWRNHENIRECGTVVPPEFSQQRIEVLNERGIVIKVLPAAKSKAELAEIARQKKIAQKKQRQIAERKRKDNILLQTYTSERDLRIGQENKVAAIKSIIDITSSNTRSLQKNLARLQKRAADYERSGQTTPDRLNADMKNLLRQIKDNDDFIRKKQHDLIDLSKQYDTDLARYRLLKQGKVKYE